MKYILLRAGESPRMNKSVLKNFATNARKELIEKVKSKAFRIGITEEGIKKAQFISSDAIYIDGKQLSVTEKQQRERLISRIQEIGYVQVVEEVAYTWFNRFTALRFMEVNNYLPTKVRVLSSSNLDSSEPDIIKEALTVDLDIDKELVYDLKLNNKTEELFKYLVIKQCNSLNRYLPFMFETIDDYKELLFPEGLLAKDSFLRQMNDTEKIQEVDWEQVEIIGWLYQFYISEKKDQVFNDLKNNVKISKETLPAATQLFTPKWIVKYMVENSLGRIWMEGNPNSPIRSEWRYYLEDVDQEDEVKKEINEISYRNVDLESITFLDPCCGSGHILVYAFEVFYSLYLEQGYSKEEIPKIILEKNLFGLDIDDRAAQLASFSVMMKAREKSRRAFNQDIKLNICSIHESNWMSDNTIESFVKGEKDLRSQNDLRKLMHYLREKFIDAKEYGSLLEVEPLNFGGIEKRLNEYREEYGTIIDHIDKAIIQDNLPQIIQQSKILSIKHDVVCTNPPYMGSNNMGSRLKTFVQSNFEHSKSDLCAVFIEAGMLKTKKNGYCSLVAMHSWFFLSSFETLRKKIINNFTITSILHLGMEAFEGIIGKVVQTAAFVIKNHHISEYKPIGIRLVDYYDGRKYEKEKQFFNPNHAYSTLKQNDFNKIPGNLIAYWVSENIIKNFDEPNIGTQLITREGMATANNERFLRYWYEVMQCAIIFDCESIDNAMTNKGKWFPYNKGGAYRKWYGNNDYIVNWYNDGQEIRNNIDEKTGRIRSHNYNGEFGFRKGITWSALSTGSISVRYSDQGFLFDSKGAKGFAENEIDLRYILGLLNSAVGMAYLEFISPTMDFKVGDVIQIPLIISNKDYVVSLVDENISISKTDWDAYETSWDFVKHPFIKHVSSSISHSFKSWEQFAETQYNKIRMNEEELNRFFNEVYGLQDELSQEVDEKFISIRKAEKERDVKSFISYAIGCSFGRYSLDKEGLIYAGGEFDASLYRTYKVDHDNILPIMLEPYFEDDIVTRFIDFISVTFGNETLSENIDFVTCTLGRKNGETARETLIRYFINVFYKEHVQTYKKRPIYWLFTSGKQKAFNCLIYMHRYDKSTLSRIRTDYLHELQIRMDAEKKTLLDIINGDSTTKEIATAKKELKSLDLKIEELRAYDEKLHHMADMQIEIDLDEGVAVNYAKFEGLLAPIK